MYFCSLLALNSKSVLKMQSLYFALILAFAQSNYSKKKKKKKKN